LAFCWGLLTFWLRPRFIAAVMTAVLLRWSELMLAESALRCHRLRIEITVSNVKLPWKIELLT
jgi:hypothetical protein